MKATDYRGVGWRPRTGCSLPDTLESLGLKRFLEEDHDHQD
jgi:hypothetical protein